MPLTLYKKPWRSHAELVTLLAQRGLLIHNSTDAEQFLAHVNYHRFSGYFLSFERPGQRHSFELGTTFENVRHAYEFDFELRDLVNEALAVVEIDLRTTVAHHFGRRHGAFGHIDPANFFSPPLGKSRRVAVRFIHADWLARLREEVKYSKERFVLHFRNTYFETGCDFDLPIWALAEVMSFGDISKMISGMLHDDQKVIAGRYGLQPHVFVSWTHHLNVARNVCAHHGRLWDRFWTVQPELPAGHAWRRPFLQDNRRLPVTLLVLFQMLKHIPQIVDWVDRWQVKLRKKLIELPNNPVADGLGFTDDWYRNPIWL